MLTRDDVAGRRLLSGLLGLRTNGLVGLQCVPLIVDLSTCGGTPVCCNGASQQYVTIAFLRLHLSESCPSRTQLWWGVRPWMLEALDLLD